MFKQKSKLAAAAAAVVVAEVVVSAVRIVFFTFFIWNRLDELLFEISNRID